MNTNEQFEKFNDEYLKFERIGNPPFHTPLICALVKIERIQGKRIDVDAQHDILCCGACERDLADDEAIYLLRCGIHWSNEFDCFCHFT